MSALPCLRACRRTYLFMGGLDFSCGFELVSFCISLACTHELKCESGSAPTRFYWGFFQHGVGHFLSRSVYWAEAGAGDSYEL